MKKIKIFLASSNELNTDRIYIGDLIRRINDNYEKIDIHIDLCKWEDFKHAYSGNRTQDEYNRAVKDSDIFIALFYTTAGKYTIEEFNVALQSFIESGRVKPYIYVYIKNTEGKTEDDKLLKFKDKLYKELGHYWIEYSHIDKLMYEIVMELQSIHTDFVRSVLQVHDSKFILEDGTVIANLKNLPFAANNNRWQALVDSKKQKQKLIERCSSHSLDPGDFEVLEEEKQQLAKIEAELESLESGMMKTAIYIANQSRMQSSERLLLAKKMFEQG